MNGRDAFAERAHVERVKSLPCSVCDTAPPSRTSLGRDWPDEMGD